MYVARRLVTDREMIEKGVLFLPGGIRKEDLLKAVEWYERRWFVVIKVEENSVGEMECVDYVKTRWAAEFLEAQGQEGERAG
jgi:hypothetical protein